MIATIFILLLIFVIIPAIAIPVYNLIHFGQAYPTSDDIMNHILNQR